MARKMDDGVERVRFCDHCNAITGWYASFCEECGEPLGGARKGFGRRGARRPTGPLADLFRAHMRLFHRYRERAEEVKKRISRLGRALVKEEKAVGRSQARQRLLSLSERVLEAEEEWEELQREFNRQSESIEEDLADNPDLPQLVGDLDPELDAALQGEYALLYEQLETAAQSLHELGRSLDIALLRQSSRVLGIPTGGRWAVPLAGAVALLLFAAGVALAALGGAEIAQLAQVFAGPLLAVVVLYLVAASR